MQENKDYLILYLGNQFLENLLSSGKISQKQFKQICKKNLEYVTRLK